MTAIRPALPADYDRITDLWEASVRATHDFLPEHAIQTLRPLIREVYLAAVDLWVYCDAHGAIDGFVGVADGRIDMLFIHPQRRGGGIGKHLPRHAIETLGASALDVNEQNPQAVGFYQHLGFVVTDRSRLDGGGRPFPILHMKLAGA